MYRFKISEIEKFPLLTPEEWEHVLLLEGLRPEYVECFKLLRDAPTGLVPRDMPGGFFPGVVRVWAGAINAMFKYRGILFRIYSVGPTMHGSRSLLSMRKIPETPSHPGSQNRQYLDKDLQRLDLEALRVEVMRLRAFVRRLGLDPLSIE